MSAAVYVVGVDVGFVFSGCCSHLRSTREDAGPPLWMREGGRNDDDEMMRESGRKKVR